MRSEQFFDLNGVRGLQAVMVKRDELLPKLVENRKKHAAEYVEARKAWTATVILTLENALAEAKAGTKFETNFHLPAPADHTREYDRAIQMLSMSTEEKIDLTAGDFAKYAMDEWEWTESFKRMSQTYIATASGGAARR